MNPDIKTQIRTILKLRKMTRKELAELSDIGESTLSRFFNDKIDIKLLTLEKIVEALGCYCIIVDKNQG